MTTTSISNGLNDMNHYFHNFHTIYEVYILVRSNMRSLPDFDMNSTSKKHKKYKYVHYSFLPHHKW